MSYFRRAPDDGGGPPERKPNQVPKDIIGEYYNRLAVSTKRPSPREMYNRKNIEIEIEVRPGERRPPNAPPEQVCYTQSHVIIDIRVDDDSDEICYIAAENGFDVHDRTYNGVSHRMGSNWIEHSVSDVLNWIKKWAFWFHAPLQLLKITVVAEDGIPYLEEFMEKARPIEIRCLEFHIDCPVGIWGGFDRRPFECLDLARRLQITNYQMRGVPLLEIAKLMDVKKMWRCTLINPQNVANLLPVEYVSPENARRRYRTTFEDNKIIISTQEP